MNDTSDPLEILDAIDRERGDSFIGMIQANQVQQLRDEIVSLREQLGEACNATVQGMVERLVVSTARKQAFEDAAKVCMDYILPGNPANNARPHVWYDPYQIRSYLATAIRALK